MVDFFVITFLWYFEEVLDLLWSGTTESWQNIFLILFLMVFFFPWYMFLIAQVNWIPSKCECRGIAGLAGFREHLHQCSVSVQSYFMGISDLILFLYSLVKYKNSSVDSPYVTKADRNEQMRSFLYEVFGDCVQYSVRCKWMSDLICIEQGVHC